MVPQPASESNGRGTIDGSDMSAHVSVTPDGFSVTGSERLRYDFVFVENVFDPANDQLAELYRPWKRCLLVTDAIVHGFYGADAQAYFDAKGIALTIHIMPGGETNKTMTTMLSLVDAFSDFGLIRKEPVLAMGGGLVTDVCGYACASYRRSTNFVRIPTTLIGLIDASVSIKVGVNHGKMKNRLGAFHAPIVTFLDFSKLATLPVGQVRNGFAELIKISAVGDLTIWNLLEEHGEALVKTRFGRAPGAPAAVRAAADDICYRGIKLMLELESPNLHELALDRVIAFGHTWSPTLELAPAARPLRHGHAIAVDMAFSVTLAWTRRFIDACARDEVLGLMHRVGLSLDHPLFDEALLDRATDAILQTRDGKQRFVVPRPIGATCFINDASQEELHAALRTHKQLVKDQYDSGDGVDAYVDFGDLGADPTKLPARDVETKSSAAVNGAGAVSSAKLPAVVANGHKHAAAVSGTT